MLCCHPWLLISVLSPTKLEEEVAYLRAILSVGHGRKKIIQTLLANQVCFVESSSSPDTNKYT